MEALWWHGGLMGSGTYRLLFSAVPMAPQSEYAGQIIEAA